MTYEETLSYIHSICWRGSRLGLERIGELCRRLGDPQKDLKFVHVAGTNGKGSICAMLTSMLMEDGRKVGTFTSPYIFSFRERMCVNGEMIPEETLAEICAEVRPHADAMEDPPTEFELITALAFVYFKREKCDVVILEAGLGGRLDSTNIIESSLVSIITGIALDHVEILGDTTAKIAAEKAGIIKQDGLAVVGRADEDAMASIKAKAEEMNAGIAAVDYGCLGNIRVALSGCTFDFADMKDLYVPLVGAYQPSNAAVAITAARILGISEECIRRGLSKVSWRGRFEVLSREPEIIFDGGHNKDGAEAVANTLYALGIEKVVLLSAVMADKEYTEMIKILSPFVHAVYTVAPEDNPRALSAVDYAAAWSVESIPSDTVKEGYDKALLRAREEKLPLLITGSLYLYSDIMKVR